jgi:hypothetical protein
MAMATQNFPLRGLSEFSVYEEFLTLDVESIPGGVVTNLDYRLSE